MSDPIPCSAARELAPEVAMGVASAEDRARLLTHVGACTDCARFLRDLSVLVDDIVALAPRHEPPAGFESDVQGRLDELAPVAGQRFDRVRRWRRLAAVAAALLIAGGASGFAVYQAHDADRTLADQVRATLATANGEYFAAAPLVDASDSRRGIVFAYQGEPTWMFLTVDQTFPLRGVAVQLVTHDGAATIIGEDLDISSRTPWGTVIPVNVHDVAVVRVTDPTGDLVLSGRVVP